MDRARRAVDERNVWIYATTDIPVGARFEHKPLIDDSRWSSGPNYVAWACA